MITVAILINGQPIAARSAVNVGQLKRTDIFEYKVDDGTVLHHRPDDGAVSLAIAMLKTIKEVGVKTPNEKAEP